VASISSYKLCLNFWLIFECTVSSSPTKVKRIEQRFQLLPTAEEKNLEFELSQINCPFEQRNQHSLEEHNIIQARQHSRHRVQDAIQNIRRLKKRENVICRQEEKKLNQWRLTSR